MWFLILGILGVTLKYFEIGGIGVWSWWVVLTPFALTVAWWSVADASGYTKRKAMEKDALRTRQRHDRQRIELGLRTRQVPSASRGRR